MVTINETIVINKITVQEEVKTPTRIGVDGISPHIGDNGNWWIGEEDTGVAASGGGTGVAPHIGENGNWFIGATDTGVKAAGVDGTDGVDGESGQNGTDGITPHIGENKHWYIGITDTGISAEGVDGQDGANGLNGITPHIGDNGNWWIGETDTGIQAIGADGQPGSDGLPGKSLTFDDLTQDQIEVLQAQLQEVYLSERESQSGKINLFGVDYDLYEKIVDIADLPKVEGAEQTYTVSTRPLGFNLYLKAEALIVPKADRGVIGDFFNESYKITRLFIDSDLNTKVTIKCLADVSEDVKATLHLQYIKDFGDMLELNITVPETVNPADVTLSFPALKYNKKNVASLSFDDSVALWNNVFSVINRRWVDDELLSYFISGDARRFFFHKDFQYIKDGVTYTKSTGQYPAKFIEYTDGAGVKHRYGFSLSAWSSKMTDRDYVGGYMWPWTTAAEARQMADFGFSLDFHDIEGITNPDIADTSQEAFDALVKADGERFHSVTDRTPKTGSYPNGHSIYNRFSDCPLIDFRYTQTNLPAPYMSGYYKPFSIEKFLDKKLFVPFRDFILNDYTLTTFKEKIIASMSQEEADRVWMILGLHAPYRDSGFYEFFTEIEALYGASGDDSLWFPAIDEFFEYWFMTKFGAVHKEVSGQNIKFKIYAPCGKNFWFRSISCLLSGIADLTGVTISSSDNCKGTSYSINDGKLLVNLDFNTDLLAKVEKYLQIFEADPAQEYAYDDAQYFVQMLKVGVREPYQARIDALVSVPSLVSIAINSGDESTTGREVSITLSGSGWTHIMVSENSDFTGAEWESFTGTTKSVTLTEGFGQKTIYVKTKNIAGESEVRSDSINYTDIPLSLSGISINSGDETTDLQTVQVAFTGEGTPTHYMLSESSDFAGAEWIGFSQPAGFTLSSGYGLKTIYAKLKNAASETSAVSDSIEYVDTTALILNSITINSGAANTGSAQVSVALSYSGNPTHYRLGESSDLAGIEWVEFSSSPVQYQLSTGYGSKTVYAQMKNVSQETAIKSAGINYVEQVILTSAIINDDDETTLNQQVSIALSYSGTPTHYRVGEDINTAEWVAFTGTPIAYTLSTGYGSKTVYTQFKNSVNESAVRSDTISYVQPPVAAVVSLSYGYGNGNIIYEVAGDVTINKTAPYSGDAYTAKQLKDKAGNLLSWYIEYNNSFYQPNAVSDQTGMYFASGTPANPTLTGDTGVYPDTYISKAQYINSVQGVATKKVARIVMTFPSGSYRMKIIMSTSSGYALSANERLNSFYKVSVNGTPGTPVVAGPEGFTGLNNTAFNAEIEFSVGTAASGNVVLYLYNTVAAGYRPGINLFEIIKIS